MESVTRRMHQNSNPAPAASKGVRDGTVKSTEPSSWPSSPNRNAAEVRHAEGDDAPKSSGAYADCDLEVCRLGRFPKREARPSNRNDSDTSTSPRPDDDDKPFCHIIEGSASAARDGDETPKEEADEGMAGAEGHKEDEEADDTDAAEADVHGEATLSPRVGT